MKQLYALVCETQRYSSVLDAVITSAGLLRAEKKLRPHLAKVAGPGGGAGLGWAVSRLRTWSPRGTVHGVTSASLPSEMRMSTL